MKLFVLVIAIAFALYGDIRPADPPAGAASGMPYLAATQDGTIYLAWTDTLAEREHALRLSRWTGSSWTAPETIARGRNWFVNWADFPSISVLGDQSILAHWLTRAEAGGTYGYGIRVAQRTADNGQWRQIHGISLDEKSDYSGFLSFVPGEGAAVYLSPPAHGTHAAGGHEEGHRKTVRFVSFRSNGTVAADQEVDTDACSCCQTAIGRTRRGLIAAYRDHSPGEIRDISVIRHANGAWSSPRTLYPDGWKINGCPTDGPSLATAGSDVAIAWLTRAGETPKVQVALSHDDGETFQAPIRLDSGNPLGRPSLAVNGDGYIAVWLEKSSESVEIRLRHVSRNGSLGEPLVVGKAPAGRAAGFPKVAVAGKQVLVAWRDERVRAVLLTPSQLNTKKSR